MLKVLLGAINVIVRLATSASRVAIGMWGWPGKHQIAMDLIGADGQMVAQANFRHALQFASREHSADRVVRVAQDEQVGAVGDGVLESIEIDTVGAIRQQRQLHFTPFHACVGRRLQERRIYRSLDQRRTAFARQRPANQVEIRSPHLAQK